MNDPLAPSEPDPTAENGRPTETADNVFVLRRTDPGSSTLGHPSGPRSGTTVDQALRSLRSTTGSGDSLRGVRAVRPEPSTTLRLALAALSVVQLGIAAAWLVGKVPFGQILGSPTDAHLSRDAALGVVLGSIGALVAWRPRWSLSLIPVVGAIVAVQTIGLIADGSNGQTGFHFELPHVLAIIVGSLTFAVSRSRKMPRATGTETTTLHQFRGTR